MNGLPELAYIGCCAGSAHLAAAAEATTCDAVLIGGRASESGDWPGSAAPELVRVPLAPAVTG